MSIFDNRSKDDLEIEIRNFLEENTIEDLLEVVNWCIKSVVECELSELKKKSEFNVYEAFDDMTSDDDIKDLM